MNFYLLKYAITCNYIHVVKLYSKRELFDLYKSEFHANIMEILTYHVERNFAYDSKAMMELG